MAVRYIPYDAAPHALVERIQVLARALALCIGASLQIPEW